jgi:hypothetical protein
VMVVNSVMEEEPGSRVYIVPAGRSGPENRLDVMLPGARKEH